LQAPRPLPVIAGRPEVHVPGFLPGVADDAETPGGQFDYLRAVVVLEAVVELIPFPVSPGVVGLFVDEEAVALAVGVEGIVLADDNLRPSVAVEVRGG